MIPPLVDRFVAGESTESAIAYAESLESDGIVPILNNLGEHYTTQGPIERSVRMYLDLIEGCSDLENATISIKPSQLGSEYDEGLMQTSMEMLVEAAVENDVYVWIDMEDSEFTDLTLQLYEELVSEYPNEVGVCLQANLKRTSDDIHELASLPGGVRLVKGAYDEPEYLAFQSSEEIDTQYKQLSEVLFDVWEGKLAFGTHDEDMISHIIELGGDERDFQLQMLMGVRESRQTELINEGYDVAQYCPYGEEWFSYFYRRLRERKSNITFMLRAAIDQLF